MLKITKVKFGSPAYRAGLRKGDEIAAFDGHKYEDALDFAYYDGQSDFAVSYIRKGKTHETRVRKEESEPMGIEYEQTDMPLRVCHNKCIFCFVDQCPKGMRRTLYVKDDDYRTSFACGSYVTLSNASEEDLERIVRLHLSPLYISVHAFDPQVKKLLCANPKSAKLFDYMRLFAQNGIQMHTQIVMVEGINDGEVLQQTLDELYALYPFVKTVAIVPVGLTGHREGLYPLKPISQACAERTIDQTEAMQRRVIAEHGSGWVWASDEMYVLADRPVPSVESYGDMEQIENGVGMVATFLQEVRDAVQSLPALHGCYTLVTGRSFEKYLRGICDELQKQYDVQLDVKAIDNDWFGHTVTVAGLLTGRDIVAQLKERGYYPDVVLPQTTLKEFESVLLDGMSVHDIEQALHCTVHMSSSGWDLIRILAGKEEENE